MNLALEIQTIQKLCLQFIISLPCRFFFGVVTPLHLAHLDLLISGDSLKRLQNLDRIL
jgi:hypothetical protein